MTADVIDTSNRTAARGRPSTAKTWLKAIELTSRIETDPQRLFADIVEDWAHRQGERPALISDAATLTYRALAARISQYARWALSAGIKPGDRVCLIMPARPDYVAAWLGISLAGGVAALINTKLVGRSLAHCINVAGAAHAVVAAEFVDAYDAARPHLVDAPRCWLHGDRGDITAALDAMDPAHPSAAERRGTTIDDAALLIFTSGTTGLPKAASISHRRILNWGGWFAGLTGASPGDRLYDCLPVYHSVGGVVAPCSMLFAGASVVLADGFSASGFWEDVVRFDCTLFQYVGELCRYLLKAAPCEFETMHRLRLACGNGLRGDIWEAFQERFAVPQILEFYAATEGNFSLYNVEGRPGAIGRVPPMLVHRFPSAIIRLDRELGAPLRGDDGLCIACARGEVGEAIGRIGTADQGGGRFEGYTDAEATEKKILRDVFAKGDAWFRTGDLMRQDAQGYFYFVDRIGDTFRWKGENVATSEVTEAILDCPGVTDATSFGVDVPGHDGRAGMAAIVAGANFDVGALGGLLSQRLPAYAHPLFLRLCAALPSTETFKQKKQQLMHDGFDPIVVTDPLYLRDPRSGAYRRLDRVVHTKLIEGAMRL
ncbi:MAG TPA: long-chain-acyl-CoA synthetase [Bradyrhizobium sp.]|nr:long-chain-acyl-CoA synthetase [Bradyrhizobium sp.]